MTEKWYLDAKKKRCPQTTKQTRNQLFNFVCDFNKKLKSVNIPSCTFPNEYFLIPKHRTFKYRQNVTEFNYIQ